MLNMQSQWNQTYLEWKLKTEQNIKEIAIFIEGAIFPTDEKAEKCEEAPRLSPSFIRRNQWKDERVRSSFRNQKKNKQENYW